MSYNPTHGTTLFRKVLFERSEFLIATSKKKSLRVCSTNLGFSEVRILYQIRMYLVSAGRNEVGYRKVA